MSASSGASAARRVRAQQGSTDRGLHFVEELPLARTAFVKRHGAGRVSFEDGLDDEAVEVLMRFEQRARKA